MVYIGKIVFNNSNNIKKVCIQSNVFFIISQGKIQKITFIYFLLTNTNYCLMTDYFNSV